MARVSDLAVQKVRDDGDALHGVRGHGVLTGTEQHIAMHWTMHAAIKPAILGQETQRDAFLGTEADEGRRHRGVAETHDGFHDAGGNPRLFLPADLDGDGLVLTVKVAARGQDV